MNWKKEAVEKLQHYGAVAHSVRSLSQELQRLQLEEKALGGFPKNPQELGHLRRRKALINNLVLQKEVTGALRQANLWVKNIDEALALLTPPERKLLRQLVMEPREDGIQKLCQELEVEQATVYRRREAALLKFTLLYYGALKTEPLGLRKKD